MDIKFLCGDCGQSHSEEQNAVKCCNGSEDSIEVSKCCEALIITFAIGEYPFDEYSACDKCWKSVE